MLYNLKLKNCYYKLKMNVISCFSLSFDHELLMNYISCLDTYEKGLMKLKKAEFMSDVNSESDDSEELKRSRKNRAKKQYQVAMIMILMMK